MANAKNEHVFPEEGGWRVRREKSKRVSRLFKNKIDAIEYAGIIALSDGSYVVSHKYNGQFKKFTQGNKIPVRTHKIAPLLMGTIEIRHPIVNNNEPIIEIRRNL